MPRSKTSATHTTCWTRLSPSTSSTPPLSPRSAGTSSSVLCSPPTPTSWTSSALVRVSVVVYATPFNAMLSAGCFAITTVFSHAQTVVLCAACGSVLCQPTGGKARLTEGTSCASLLHPSCSISAFPQGARTVGRTERSHRILGLRLLRFPCSSIAAWIIASMSHHAFCHAPKSSRPRVVYTYAIYLPISRTFSLL